MLKLAFWIFVLVLALSFFGISLKAIIASPAGQENFAYLFSLIVAGWQWFVQFATNFIQHSVAINSFL